MLIKKLPTRAIANPDHPIASTPNGRLRGVELDGLFMFRGVKYANADRFMMPTPPDKWEGVKEALIYGYACPEFRGGWPGDQFMVPHAFYRQDEACQYLNIWTKSLDAGAKKPVMVWLHGGGYSSGSGIEHYAYDGENLCRNEDVVVVTLNHRLNVFGHLDLSRYGEEFKYSGNCGIADLVAALRWVKENIASFGGDPDNVTVFGQSGGGGKVTTLLQSPSADGLFHRAIVQSGVMKPTADSAAVREDMYRLADLVVEELGLTKETIGEIKTVPDWQLIHAAERASRRVQEETGRRANWAPCPDGDFYIGNPFTVGFRKETVHIPLMVGTVFAEGGHNAGRKIGDGYKNAWDEETKMGHLRDRFGDETDAVVEAFRAAYPGENIADALYIDSSGRKASKAYAKLRAESGCEQVYNYLFTLESEFNGGTLAWHNSEIPYVFANADYLEASYIPGVTENLQKMMSGAWASFARTGDPNHEGMPTLPRVTKDEVPTVIFDRETTVKTGHDDALMAFLADDRFAPLTKKK